VSTTPSRPSSAIGESAYCVKSLAKVKAPFVLTNMGRQCKPPLIWVWSLRGKRWIVDQEISLDVTRKRGVSGS
jgi:hypothetical protein